MTNSQWIEQMGWLVGDQACSQTCGSRAECLFVYMPQGVAKPSGQQYQHIGTQLFLYAGTDIGPAYRNVTDLSSTP